MMRRAFLVIAALAVSAFAQQAPSLTPEQVQALTGLADQVKAALQVGDVEKAAQLTIDLQLRLYKIKKAAEPTAEQKLADLERSAPPDELHRFYELSRLANAAFDAGELDKAESYAKELLGVAPRYPKDCNYGNAIFFGNMVVGRVALRRDHNVALAKASLLAAGRTPGSPQLNSFGPNMSLAKDLLAAGERDVVLEFFELCRSFWKMGGARLDDWTHMVKGGGIPDFGANLRYS
jgi:hypothetical protein